MISKSPRLKAFVAAIAIAAGPLSLAIPAPAKADIGFVIGISVHIAPPILPIYVQPPIPAPGYLWTPGYWAWGGNGYYWVPGTWVEPPGVGLLWTPPYWGWSDGVYLFHAGYWGPHIGFYGGVNYGFGYFGHGFDGGRWEGGRFAYNQAYNNFGGVHVTNVYRNNVTNITNTRVSYVGGSGLHAEPTAEERVAESEHHEAATAVQERHFSTAIHTPTLAASYNHGRPAVLATSHPGVFRAPNAGARPVPAAARFNRPAEAPRPAGPPRAGFAPERAAPARAAAPRERPAEHGGEERR